MFKRILITCISALLVNMCIYTHVTLAALGELTNSIEKDRRALSAEKGVVKTVNEYTIYEIASASTTVREYVSPSGVIFGIAWNGLTHPDLTKLLGSYTAEYERALQQRHQLPGSSSRRHFQISTESIVVEKWGHMRNLQGRAYVPSLIPAGVSADDIK